MRFVEYIVCCMRFVWKFLYKTRYNARFLCEDFCVLFIDFNNTKMIDSTLKVRQKANNKKGGKRKC